MPGPPRYKAWPPWLNVKPSRSVTRARPPGRWPSTTSARPPVAVTSAPAASPARPPPITTTSHVVVVVMST